MESSKGSSSRLVLRIFFKDLDENKPSGSIKIRVETIDYFLRRYREEVIRKRHAEQNIEAQLAELEAQLRREFAKVIVSQRAHNPPTGPGSQNRDK